MNQLTRRQLLASFLGGLVSAAGTVVLARSVLPAESTLDETTGPLAEPQLSLAECADQVAADQQLPDEAEGQQPISFVNGGFRNGGGGGGGFRKGGFANGGGGGGAFKNGGFANGGGGGGAFKNGGFANGGGGGGAFKNGAFRN